MRLQVASVAAAAIVLAGWSGHVSAANDDAPPPEVTGPVDPQTFLGTWHDDQDRFWFTIDRIDGNQVTAARFWLASLKEGRVDGNTLTLTSRSCVPVIGCYEYTAVAKLLVTGQIDMTGTSENCRFWHECREGIDEVNQILARQ
jgi:hypothetical protein